MPADRHIDMSEVRKLMRDLREIEPELAKGVRREFRALAKVVAQDARARAGAYSRTGRMAKSIVPRADSSANAAITSPHPGMRTAEFGGRVPLFGDAEHWYQQKPRPAMYPAVEGRLGDFEKHALAALDVALRKAGIR